LSGADWLTELRGLASGFRPFPMRFDQLVLQMSLFMALMPVASALTLQIFRQSMRKARVNPVHAWRCGINAGDVIVWNGIWQTAMVLMFGASPIPSEMDLAMAFMTGGIAIVFFFNTWRLCLAYRRYMQFRDAVETILASELILLLLFLAVPLRYIATTLLS